MSDFHLRINATSFLRFSFLISSAQKRCTWLKTFMTTAISKPNVHDTKQTHQAKSQTTIAINYETRFCLILEWKTSVPGSK